MAGVKSQSKEARQDTGDIERRPHWGALAVFAMLMLAAPLAFGAVDRIVQLGLILLFSLGLLICPLRVVVLGRRTRAVLYASLALIVVKDFAPAAWFGSTAWRNALAADYAIRFPWMHHPEPGRAVDVLLAGTVGLLWFLWVRTLSASRENRAWIAWTLFAAAGTVAAVSFATKGMDAKAIYGMRFTPGWFGFGPFPNRNHTASFLAMGALVGCGCLTWAVRRRQWGGVVLGTGTLLITLAALLATQSRGGLLAFAAGIAVYVGFVLLKFRSPRITALALSMIVALAALALAFGGPVLARFSSSGGDVSNASRVLIWKDTLALWWDAPLLGHGLGSFVSVFPLWQTIPLDNQVVLHPESSWLLWVAEFGAVPLLLGVLLTLVLVWPHLKAMLARRTSFFLFAGAVAAVFALVVHALIDVPAHRWGTAAFALAALGLICPAARLPEASSATRKIVLLPIGIAVFWAWPFLYDTPAWSPSTFSRTLARAQTSGVSESELDRMIRYFPLNAKLHHLLGVQQLRTRGRFAPEWQPHFQAAVRLAPGSWATPMGIAQVCGDVSPGHALHYWQIALERSGSRRDELFGRALVETAGFPGARATWASYAENHPSLLLLYAQTAPPAEGRGVFERWLRERAGRKDFEQGEVDAFYRLAGQWASVEQIEDWMARQPERRAKEYRQWARLLHSRGADLRAWTLLESSVPEPAYPPSAPSLPLERLENAWKMSPESVVNAQTLAYARSLAGDPTGEREIVFAVAARENAPQWFRQKAAHFLADSGEVSAAVALLLREK